MKVIITSEHVVGNSSRTDKIFLEQDIIDVAAQSTSGETGLKIITCPIIYHSYWSWDEDPFLRNVQHTVVVAFEKGVPLIEGYYVALPCPPHCGEKGYISYADYLKGKSGLYFTPVVFTLLESVTKILIKLGLIKKR